MFIPHTLSNPYISGIFNIYILPPQNYSSCLHINPCEQKEALQAVLMKLNTFVKGQVQDKLKCCSVPPQL